MAFVERPTYNVGEVIEIMISYHDKRKIYANIIAERRPDAVAQIKGSQSYPHIKGTVSFYQVNKGVLVVAEIFGLPNAPHPCSNGIFAMHIHEGVSCMGNAQDPFADAGMHYNPQSCPHPQHAGDLPPLFSNYGYAFNVMLTNRFTVKGVTGRTVIIHSNVDDFTSQPAGNAGAKIACGVIL
jgi:Cu-Zn family superoxide dismutase